MSLLGDASGIPPAVRGIKLDDGHRQGERTGQNSAKSHIAVQQALHFGWKNN
jgi:hypothetical protein